MIPIHEREQQLREITDQLLAGGADSVDTHLSEIRGFITKRLGDLQQLISGEPAEARKELVKHVSEIRMFPQDADGDGNRKSHYVAEGTWRLVGSEEETGNVMSPQIRSVADPRNHPKMSLIRVPNPYLDRRAGLVHRREVAHPPA